MTVLLTDGEQRATLALVRALGQAGHRPYVCAAQKHPVAGASRYAVGVAVTRDALRDPVGFVDDIVGLVARWDIRQLIPVTEPALLAVLAARGRFRGVEVPFPNLETFRRVCDKAAVLEAAREVGIHTPEQRLVDAPGDSLELDSISYPVVLKPSRSVSGEHEDRRKFGVSYASDAASLREQLSGLPPAAYPVLLQKRVVGPGVGIFLLIWHGETLATFSHRRLREKPPSGGVSVYRESIPADPVLVEKSRALLNRLDWEGVAMVEYKVEAATGEAYLMEINGRFWGSLQLALDAGVDFPGLLLRAASGEAVTPQSLYRTGIRSRWWWGDVDHMLALIRKSRAELNLPPDTAPRWRTLLDFLVLWRPGDRSEVFRWSDPGPFFRESLNWFRRR